MTNQKKEETPVTDVSTQIVEQKNELVNVENQVIKSDADIDGFIDLRQKFIAKVNAICVEGKDYHVIQGKKSLAKGGAEKIASIFKWTAKFEKDTESLEMLGDIKGLVAYKCTLVNGHFVGEGRGAALLSKNGGDPNKTMKMAQKSAFIDATLRASGLSDFFTQDLENMDIEDIKKPFDKMEWQRNNRNRFKQDNGYSQTTHYRFDGMRDLALKRDGYNCVVCGMSDTEHKEKWQKPITVDHINKNENDNRLENLQTLCLVCHGKKDISPELTEPQILPYKAEILEMRRLGKSYQFIADKLGFSLAGVWKNVQKWILEYMPREQISEKPNFTSPRYSNPKTATPKQREYIKNLCDKKGVSLNQLKELSITYNNPSDMIGYLQKLPDKNSEELPTITVDSEELSRIADSIPF